MITLTGSPALKVQVMCEGIRYTPALGAAAAHSMPNYYPYRFKEGERDPTGRGIATIPYLINTPDGTEIRIMGNGDSPWHVEGSRDDGYLLIDDRGGHQVPIEFEPLRPWLTQKTADGLPFSQAGVTTHGDMLVINVAPGCEYFLHKHDGVSMRCTFCAYGAPDERTVHLGQKREVIFHESCDEAAWTVTLAGTGEETMTGARLKRIEKYIKGDLFMMSYGDGVGNVDLGALLEFHRKHGKLVTLTGVRPPGRFGELVTKDNLITEFNEKPQTTAGRINGGFFVFSRKFFDYLNDDPGLILEQAPLRRVAADGQLVCFPHDGFWQPMDTFREFELLNQLWKSDKAPWKIW